ncbi:GAF domain-containing sensor histidine kinase [Fodinicurvata halophila]|uniref:histidine kinase n=1 Tax=Fodinicurvata halophila TaxID=1419723 RepID=A0ABV8UJH5_9PROT
MHATSGHARLQPSGNETERLRALEDYQLLESEADPRFERIVEMAVDLFDVPIAYISLLDDTRQWFKASTGLDFSETPLAQSFCLHSIQHAGVTVIEDARLDARFSALPMVTDNPGTVFYASVPLVTPDGFRHGTLCLMDRHPRRLDDKQRRLLSSLAEIAVDEMELHRASLQLIKEKQEARRAARIKDDFLAMMSHEFRTPLNAILGFSEVIRAQAMGPVGHEKYLDYAQDIHNSGQHLLSLIDDLLDSAHFGRDGFALQEEAFDPARVAVEALDMMERKAELAGLELRHSIQPHAFRFHGDARRFRQIVLNLLSNAIKFTPAGGRVLLRLKRLEDGRLRLQVADSGIGMTPRERQQAREVFYRGEASAVQAREGAGIGLSLVDRFAQAHGGALGILSRPGRGSVLRVDLPAARLLA